jgi:AraC-like DNA-binding protein
MIESSYIQSFSLFIMILGIIICIYNWRTNKNIIYLTLFLVIYPISIVSSSLVVHGGSVFLLAILLANVAPLYFLSGPLLYFFVRGIVTDSSRFRKTDLLHFIPFFVNLVAITPYILTPFEYKLEIANSVMQDFYAYKNYDFKLFYPHYINNIGRSLLLTVYIIVSFILIIKSQKKIKQTIGALHQQFEFVRNWLFLLLGLVFIVSCIHFSLGTLSVFSNNISSFIKVGYIFVNVGLSFYLIIPIFILFSPKILYGMPKFNKEDLAVNTQKKEEEPIQLKTRNLTEDENEAAIELSKRIMTYLRDEKPYLQPDFSIHDISIKFNRPLHHIYYCFGNVINKNFSEVKNELRVQHAIDLLSSNEVDTISLEGIGKKAGFQSNSNFYVCFRKNTGKTPKEWLEENEIKYTR